MTTTSAAVGLPDAPARLAALTNHDRTLLVEAGAGSGKTALLAGRIALLIVAGVPPREIVAITFTEAAASELLERVEHFVQALTNGHIPTELTEALPQGLTAVQREALEHGARSLDEITCTTIHGFCQQLVKPYPVEARIDPGAAIIDPAAAELAYQDLMGAWLSARFGRDRGAEGLGRIPPIAIAGSEEDFFAELFLKAPDETLKLIEDTARFLKFHRTAQASDEAMAPVSLTRFADAVDECAQWYNHCGVVEPTTGELIEDLARVAALARQAAAAPLTGRRIAELLFHTHPIACKKDETAFKQWGRKGKWKEAAKAVGRSTAQGEQLTAAGEGHYRTCGEAYQAFCSGLGTLAFRRFVAEFDALKDLYRNYKRDAALLDFDDLLYHARDLLRDNEAVRQALARRYPRILVDEFQDTDPLQAEILWRLAGEGDAALPWQERSIRAGTLFLVGDPKQAIYRFRGADVETYLVAKRALAAHDPAAVRDISANFRSQAPILEFVNARFTTMLDASEGQPGFTALSAVRARGDEPSVATFEITLGDGHRNANGGLVVDLVRREEAAVVADLVSRLIGNCPVWDKDTEAFRPARAGDIALLAPTGTSLWIYERALESRDVPIATQAGKGFFRRQEVHDLIAVTRTIADRRDTLALGALLRGPLVGMSEEEIADAIAAIQATTDSTRSLHLWTDPALVEHPVLKQTLIVLQNLTRKARRTNPYQLLAEAVEELHVRSLLKARHPKGAERALANVELVLEMARAYAARGIADFASALGKRWEDGDAQSEGRPDAEAQAVSIVTIHSAKGLEWPIVVPINSTTALWSDQKYLYRRSDDSVHFKVFDFPSPDYENVKQQESNELRRERVRLWYVALTRARDLLLLPKQNERIEADWLSLIDLNLDSLPVFDPTRFDVSPQEAVGGLVNTQDLTAWAREAATISASQRQIAWHQPSRHEGAPPPAEVADDVFVEVGGSSERPSAKTEEAAIQGGRERGVILHKLIEEVLTGETAEDVAALQLRASALMDQLGLADVADAATGLSSVEMADTVQRALQLPEIVSLRSRLVPEFRVYAAEQFNRTMTLTAGICDAVAVYDTGRIEAAIDWKSDVDPTPAQIDDYRSQIRDYVVATGAPLGLIVFLTSGRVERVLAIS
jgi:exodeoxyribonuclease-5